MRLDDVAPIFEKRNANAQRLESVVKNKLSLILGEDEQSAAPTSSSSSQQQDLLVDKIYNVCLEDLKKEFGDEFKNETKETIRFRLVLSCRMHLETVKSNLNKNGGMFVHVMILIQKGIRILVE